MEGLLSTWPTPSSLDVNQFLSRKYVLYIFFFRVSPGFLRHTGGQHRVPRIYCQPERIYRIASAGDLVTGAGERERRERAGERRSPRLPSKSDLATFPR